MKKQSGGKAGGDVKSATGGMKIKTSFPPDRSSHSLSNTKGGKMGGGTSNLDHSLKGASAVQRGKSY